MTTVKVLKIHKWWTSHYGRMMAFVYLVVAASPSPPPLGAFVATLCVFTIASLGIGSFGQLLNDLTDVSQDLRSGTQNLVARRGVVARIALFAAALAVGLAPWWWLPTTPAIAALLAAEYLLFALYSLPPFRLKNRGILGPVADALYGYVVPNAVAVLLFAGLGDVASPGLGDGASPALESGVSPLLVAAIAAWSFIFGLEQILHHQLVDATRDRVDGMRTFVVVRGWRPAFEVLLRVVLPLEWIAFVALLAAIAPVAPAVPACFAVSLAVLLAGWSRRSLANAARPDRMPPVDRVVVLADLAIARFTRRWLPLLALVSLVVARPEYLPLVLPHLVLFPEPVLWLCRGGVPETLRLLRRA